MNAIFWRDLRLAIGAGGGFGQGLGFFLIVIFLVILAVGPGNPALPIIGPAVIFVAVLLAGILSLDRMFRADDADGTLIQLRLSQVPLAWVVLIKSLVHWLTTGLAIIVITPVAGIFFNMGSGAIIFLMLALLIGSPALSLIGAIGAALTLSIGRASLIQALITMPLYLPTLIYGSLAASVGEKQFAAYILLAGVSLMSLVLAPLAASFALSRHQL